MRISFIVVIALLALIGCQDPAIAAYYTQAADGPEPVTRYVVHGHAELHRGLKAAAVASCEEGDTVVLGSCDVSTTRNLTNSGPTDPYDVAPREWLCAAEAPETATEFGQVIATAICEVDGASRIAPEEP